MPALAGRRPGSHRPLQSESARLRGLREAEVVARRVVQLLSHSRAFASSIVRWRSASAGRVGLAVSSDRSEDDQRTRSFGRGCAKTSARFHTDLFRSLLRGLKALRNQKIAKNFARLDPLQILAEFLHGLDPKRAFPFGPGTKLRSVPDLVIQRGFQSNSGRLRMADKCSRRRLRHKRPPLGSEPCRSDRQAYADGPHQRARRPRQRTSVMRLVGEQLVNTRA